MPEQPQTLYDARQQLQAERERHAREGTTPVTSYARPKPSKAEQAEADRLNAARALPDALFEDDPEVQSLAATLRIKTALIERRTHVRDWLGAQMARMDAAITDAERAIPQAILEDAVSEDGGFTQARQAIAALELAKAVRVFADGAWDAVAHSSPGAQHALYNARDAARTALEDRLFTLKLAHVDAQAQAGQEQAQGGV